MECFLLGLQWKTVNREEDRGVWMMDNNGRFSLKGLYSVLGLDYAIPFLLGIVRLFAGESFKVRCWLWTSFKEEVGRQSTSVLFAKRRKNPLITLFFFVAKLGFYGSYWSHYLVLPGLFLPLFLPRSGRLLGWHGSFMGRRWKQRVEGCSLVHFLDYLEGKKLKIVWKRGDVRPKSQKHLPWWYLSLTQGAHRGRHSAFNWFCRLVWFLLRNGVVFVFPHFCLPLGACSGCPAYSGALVRLMLLIYSLFCL